MEDSFHMVAGGDSIANNSLLEVDDPNDLYDSEHKRWKISQKCTIAEDKAYSDVSLNQCKDVCKDEIEKAQEERRMYNYSYMGFYPLDKGIPWEKLPGSSLTIGCFIFMSAIKLVLDPGSLFLSPAGKVIDAGLAYPEDEDPAGAFQWWTTPCDRTDLVPANLKKAIDILRAVTDVGKFKPPKDIGKGSGKNSKGRS
ncbi:hypothetical protein AJ80_03367 [Polytolypa hystricis UAMH7299]|uniref:Uncharacterized protein n=1 Tax=Polytolypa hystricis (strain UAMH7299) TaxID=1447883 RepID=A0A2B7YID7_POLH7|nr:hypothetical protein AJ80_03367 [Polytolypa hystricis UAMH7299]